MTTKRFHASRNSRSVISILAPTCSYRWAISCEREVGGDRVRLSILEREVGSFTRSSLRGGAKKRMCGSSERCYERFPVARKGAVTPPTFDLNLRMGTDLASNGALSVIRVYLKLTCLAHADVGNHRVITTERDVERCVFYAPKDRHVFPWVEVNARFGVIERK